MAGEQQNDAVTKTVFTNGPPSWSSSELIANNASGSGLFNTAGNIAKGSPAAGGVVTVPALFSVTMTAVLQSLPMLQAVLLLGIYALLPLVVMLSVELHVDLIHPLHTNLIHHLNIKILF